MRDGIATIEQAAALVDAVKAKQNIVVAGGTGSGKTTLLNALLAEETFVRSRVAILEDTAELQCQGPSWVQLLTKRTQPQITMRDLVQMTLRLLADRIVVGESETAPRSKSSRPGTPAIPAGRLRFTPTRLKTHWRLEERL